MQRVVEDRHGLAEVWRTLPPSPHTHTQLQSHDRPTVWVVAPMRSLHGGSLLSNSVVLPPPHFAKII